MAGSPHAVGGRTIKTGLSRATRQFLLSTTLHGFKYLYSGFHTDRICWLWCCVASACCAGALCAVLWARFQQVPALLTVRSATSGAGAGAHRLPTVAVCLPAQSAAYLLLRHLSRDKNVVRRLVPTFSRVLEGKEAPEDHLLVLEQLLRANNVTVVDALCDKMPSCDELVKRCRRQDTMVPCGELFRKRLTQFGVCCVMEPSKIKNPLQQNTLDSTLRLDLVLQCSNGSLFYGCQFFTKYLGEEETSSVLLAPGSEYLAKLTFNSVQDGDSDRLVGATCVADELYSRTLCLNKCMEKVCGCSNPLRSISQEERDVPCQVSQINCLRITDNSACKCMPPCGKLLTDLELEDSPMTSISYTFDPLYSDLNVSDSTVLNLRVLLDDSRIFTRQPTETWFTLLSSLGGVFNMFLGVGLFSALEFIFFILVRVPAAMKQAAEMDMSVSHVHTHSFFNN